MHHFAYQNGSLHAEGVDLRTIAAEGTSVLLVEQSANVALNLADRLSVMERGRIVLDVPADVLRQSPDRLASVYLSGSIAAEVGS